MIARICSRKSSCGMAVAWCALGRVCPGTPSDGALGNGPGWCSPFRLAASSDAFGSLVPGNLRPVDEMLRSDILADRRAAEEARPDGEGRGQIGLEPRRSLAARRIDHDPVDLDGGGVVQNDLIVGRVDRGGMAGAGKPQQRACLPDRLLDAWRHIDAQHRAELLARQVFADADQFDRCHQNLDPLVDLDPGLFRDPSGVAADGFDIEAALVEEVTAKSVGFSV